MKTDLGQMPEESGTLPLNSLKSLMAIFQNYSLRRGYTEDDCQEAITIVVSRQGREFLNKDTPLVMRYLIRALNEARRNNTYTAIPHFKSGSVEECYIEGADVVVEQKNNYDWELDKLLKRAKLTNQQRQDFTFFMKGYSYKAIGDICGRPYQSVQQSISAVKDKCIAVRVGSF